MLALAPDSELLAARALSQAIAAGDYKIALASARILEKKGNLAPDARLLLIGESLLTRDWKAADAHIARLEEGQIFGFMAPVLRAWLAFGSRKGDPVKIIDAAKGDQLAAGYSAEHRPLLLLARGKREGIAELLAVLGQGGRSARIRIAGAATLQTRGDQPGALQLLQGDEAPIRAARAMVEAGKQLPGAITSPAHGVALFLTRVAIDLHSQETDQAAITYGRLATFLAPENSETWMVTSELLGASEQPQQALALLSNVGTGDPYAAQMRDLRIRLLVETNSKEAALGEAEAAVKAASATAGDWTRLADLYVELDRFPDAAKAYGEALQRVRGGAPGQPEWTLWLLQGSALEQGGNWPEARASLQKAYELAPDQSVVLNYLGYAQLERRENVEEAMKLIVEASKLQPDSPEITDSLGWAHYLRGNLRAAIELLEKAAAARPADTEINEHLGDAYYSAGRRFEARYAWEAARLHAEEKDAQRLGAKIEGGLTPKLASP